MTRTNDGFGTTCNNASTSRFKLEETLNHKRNQFLEQRRITAVSPTKERPAGMAAADDGTMSPAATIGGSSPLPPLGALLDGDDNVRGGRTDTDKGALRVKLMSTTQEHTDKIVGLALHPDMNTFASCSRDGLVKLWSVDALNGGSHIVPAAVSRHSLRYGRPFTACGYMPKSGQLALASEDRVLQLCDQNVSRVLRTFVTDEEDGPVTRLQCQGELIYAITHHSAVYTFDPRADAKGTRSRTALQPLWRGQLKNCYGLVTSFCVDPISQHLAFFTGSSATTRNMILWDLRFAGLEVAVWAHNNQKAITVGSWALPRNGRATEVFTASNKEGELSLWDLTTQTRTDVLWSAHTKPFVYMNDSVTQALTPSCVNPELVLTGGRLAALVEPMAHRTFCLSLRAVS